MAAYHGRGASGQGMAFALRRIEARGWRVSVHFVIDTVEMHDLVEDAWAFCVPKRVADEYATARGYESYR